MAVRAVKNNLMSQLAVLCVLASFSRLNTKKICIDGTKVKFIWNTELCNAQSCITV